MDRLTSLCGQRGLIQNLTQKKLVEIVGALWQSAAVCPSAEARVNAFGQDRVSELQRSSRGAPIQGFHFVEATLQHSSKA